MANIINNKIIEDIRNLLIYARGQLQQSVNSAMVQTYWQIGKMIVEDEQKGEHRAKYGKKQLEQISDALSGEFGKGFDARNLRNMRQFYLTFPIWNTVSTKLSWSHYRVIMRIENQKAREWYINETIENNWSVRALERQISTLYYERLLSSSEKSEAVAKYSVLSDSKQLFASKYLPFLPTEEELKKELLRERNLIENKVVKV